MKLSNLCADQLMTTFAAIEILQENRLLRSSNEVEAFEQALSAVAGDLRMEDLPSLHLILDDSCEHMEVMFGLLHLIETFPARQHLCAFIKVMPELVVNGHQWSKIIHYRILNHHLCRQLYQALLKSADCTARDTAASLLQEILGEEPECSMLHKSAREVLHELI